MASRFDDSSREKKHELLRRLLRERTIPEKSLLPYMEVLLFLCAHPADRTQLVLCGKQLMKIARQMGQWEYRHDESFDNSGLPYARVVGGYTHDLIRSLFEQTGFEVEIDSYGDSGETLNDVLRVSLPSVERELTSASMTNSELLNALQVKKKDRLRFLVSELSKLDETPVIKDQLFDGLEMTINILPSTYGFSRAFNRLTPRRVFFHDAILKKFDHNKLMDSPLPHPSRLSPRTRKNIIDVIKNSLTLTSRETDPVTYLDEGSLRYYELERGISIAIFGMDPIHQLPLESYIGYTLFKNGYPAAYGGGWVFGNRSMFGINIFESFRGGESGFMMCQLLRVYRHAFGVRYFEVEPYQYGADNPEGIESAAFWFYYRYGFRPLDKKLLQLSKKEHQKLKDRKDYRTSKKVLLEFTKSNIALNFNSRIPPAVGDFTKKITSMISRRYKGDRTLAVEDSINSLLKLSGKKLTSFKKQELRTLEEFALLAKMMKLRKGSYGLLVKMIKSKPVDAYRYQRYLLDFLQRHK